MSRYPANHYALLQEIERLNRENKRLKITGSDVSRLEIMSEGFGKYAIVQKVASGLTKDEAEKRLGK